MTSLKAAAGPGVRLAGMNYYLPALAEWRNGLSGQAIAWLAEKLAATYNDWLDRVYAKSGARVANVFGAFDTANFAGKGATPGAGDVPRNVHRPCSAGGRGRAPPRPEGLTSTPTRRATRSSRAPSCKPPTSARSVVIGKRGASLRFRQDYPQATVPAVMAWTSCAWSRSF